MATSIRGSCVVGYNVDAAVDTKHHLIAAHELMPIGSDRPQLAPMSKLTEEVLGIDHRRRGRSWLARERTDPGMG